VLLASTAAVAAAVAGAVWLGPSGQGEKALSSSEPEQGAQDTSTQQPSPDQVRERAGVRDALHGPFLPESDPVRVTIPSLGVTSRLVDLGLTPTGAMDVPVDPADAGWYTKGPTPGALGPAVIAGHVTWNGAPAVFFRLGTLQSGDRVEVTRDDGRTAVFAVQRVAGFPKDAFPTRAVYGAVNHAGLRLITCGGLYDASEQRYLDNVVAFARLQEVRGPRGS
jgi:sortase (surface protein transpeptidase)